MIHEITIKSLYSYWYESSEIIILNCCQFESRCNILDKGNEIRVWEEWQRWLTVERVKKQWAGYLAKIIDEKWCAEMVPKRIYIVGQKEGRI